MISHIFGLPFLNVTLEAAAADVTHDAMSGNRRRVYFVNAHCINVAWRNAEYRRLLRLVPTLFADGIGMRIAGLVAGQRLVENVNGTDLFPLLCEKAANQGIRIALLGAKPGVAERCARRMTARFPGLQVVWTSHGFIEPSAEAETIASLNNSKAHMLFVAMGVPQQEFWIDQNFREINVPVVLGVGALFDFYSGDVLRAPQGIRRFGLEWVYRLCQEPSRLAGRYLIGNPVFLVRVLLNRIGFGPFQSSDPPG